MPTLSWKYGCSHPLDWGDDVTEQLRLQVVLWNRLCDIEDWARAEYRRIMAGDERVSALEARIGEADGMLQSLLSERAALRKAARRKAGVAPDLDARIKEAAAALKGLRLQSKEARAAARAATREPLSALEAARRERVKAARQLTAQEGLWWGHYNAVIASFEAARQQVMKLGAVIRRRHFDGTGRLTVQVQGGMTPEDLFGGARSEVRVGQALPATRKWHHLILTAYARGRQERRTVTVPMALHRHLPDGGLIKSVTLVIRRAAPGQMRYDAVFAVTVPEAPRQESVAARPAAAVNVGWRTTPAGLRIATLVDTAGRVEQVILSEDILQRFELCEEMQADIDAAMNAMWADVRSMEWGHAPAAMAEALEQLRQARRPHPRHLVRLLREWDDGWEPSRQAMIRTWLRQDLRERRRHKQTLERTQRRRRDWMRKLVAAWVRRYGRIIVDEFSIARAGKIDPVEDTGSSQARKQARRAAPGELRAWIQDAGRRAGLVIEERGGRLTSTCHVCGAPTSVPPDAVMHRCMKCGALWDRDENACRNMLVLGTSAAAE